MSSFSSTGTAVGGLSWAEPKRDGHHDFTDTQTTQPPGWPAQIPEDEAVGQNRRDRGSYCNADAPPAMPS